MVEELLWKLDDMMGRLDEVGESKALDALVGDGEAMMLEGDQEDRKLVHLVEGHVVGMVSNKQVGEVVQHHHNLARDNSVVVEVACYEVVGSWKKMLYQNQDLIIELDYQIMDG